MDWTMFAYRLLAALAARRVLIGRLRARRCHEMGRFTRADVDEFLKGAWARYRQRGPDFPPQPTLGSAMNVRLACFTMAFFDELLAGGVERDYAIEIVADTTWRVYQLWAKIALAIARVSPWRRTVLGFARVDDDRGARSISLGFPFNAPGYLIEPVASDHDIAFNVVRCPVASYFLKYGGADLCVASWCNLDYALAELTHERLIRTQTLASGGDRCDFRVIPGRGDARKC